MDQCMRANGKMINPMDGVDVFIKTEMFTRVNGKTIKHREKVFIPILTVQGTMATGKKTNSTDMVLRHGQMDRDMKVSMLMERSMEKAIFNGEMALPMREISLRTIFKELESTTGPMAGVMKENG